MDFLFSFTPSSRSGLENMAVMRLANVLNPDIGSNIRVSLPPSVNIQITRIRRVDDSWPSNQFQHQPSHTLIPSFIANHSQASGDTL
jgi:hypothetical protein